MQGTWIMTTFGDKLSAIGCRLPSQAVGVSFFDRDELQEGVSG